MASELSINELLQEMKASLILLTTLRLKGVPSTNHECDMEQEIWAWRTTAYGQLPVFVNKVLLDPSHAHLLTSIAHGCFPATKAELSSYNRDHMAAKPKIYTVWPSTEYV